MEQAQLIEQLQNLQNTFDEKDTVPGAKSIYLASPFFTDHDHQLLMRTLEALAINPTVAYVHVPLLAQYQNITAEDVKQQPELQNEWATKTFQADIVGMQTTDLTLAIFTTKDQDIGTAYEVGYTNASNKPVVALFDGDRNQYPINLMVAYGVVDFKTQAQAFFDYDFRKLEPQKYTGALI